MTTRTILTPVSSKNLLALFKRDEVLRVLSGHEQPIAAVAVIPLSAELAGLEISILRYGVRIPKSGDE